MDSFFAFVLFIAGIYVIYAAQELKRQDKINPSLMRTPKNGQLRIEDMDAYKEYMYPKVMLFGVVTMILGLCYLVLIVFASQIGALITGTMELIVLIVFFAVLFYYMHCVKVAEKKFGH